MTEKYTKQCWYCGAMRMMPYLNGSKCTVCGATYVPLPDNTSPALAAHGYYIRDDGGNVIAKAHRSKASTTRRVAKKR